MSKKFKYFTLLAEYRDKVDGTPKIYFKTKRMRSVALCAKVIHPPEWAQLDDGYIHGAFWPSDAGKLWLSSEMEKYSNELSEEKYDYLHHTLDDTKDYYFR